MDFGTLNGKADLVAAGSCGNAVSDALVDGKPVTIGLNAGSKP